MLKRMKTNWKRAVSGFLAAIMMIGILPSAAFAADTAPTYAPTGNFELNVAGSTARNGSDQSLTIYKTEGGTAKVTTISTATPFALLEDNGGDRLKVGYTAEGGWTGSTLDGTGWADKDNILVNLPDVLPSIAYDRDTAKQFSSRLTRFEYVVPGTYDQAEQLALLQREAMSIGETLGHCPGGHELSVPRRQPAHPGLSLSVRRSDDRFCQGNPVLHWRGMSSISTKKGIASHRGTQFPFMEVTHYQ